MTMLKVKYKKTTSPEKVVSIMLKQTVNSYMTIYTIAKEITKTSIIRKLVDDWILQQNHTDTTDSLIRDIAKRASIEWLVYSNKHKHVSFGQYKLQLKDEFMHKGLLESQIEKILMLIKDAKSK
jgi:DNA-directed RNA polymerase subunit L